MENHNYIAKIIEETIDEIFKKSFPDKSKEYKTVLSTNILNLLQDKYCNETVYARTQSIDLQLKADIVRELGPAMKKLDEENRQ